MPKKVVVNAAVERWEVLDVAGKVDEKLMPQLSDEEIKQLYQWMVLTRTFDEKAVNLQRQGRLGTYAPMLGQEATIIGAASALQKDDWAVPCFRENGVFMYKGFPMEMLLQYWGGDERGMKIPENINMLPVCIPVATQTLHATGVAFGLKYDQKQQVVAVFFGDGATSEGDFHEALNMAGVLQLPIIFICQNNQWAISVPRKQQTASQTIAQKAVAYGFPGVQVDGNDIFAVIAAVRNAAVRARTGKGPTLIECETYRMSHHTTADDATRYRSLQDVESWKIKDPIARLEKFMDMKKLWSAQYAQEVQIAASKQVEDAVQKYESLAPQDPLDIFNFMFASLTPQLREQQKALRQELQGGV
ncbi:MAG: pyruvate dehydrogenase (acetyl-transferring) E1 component subunit alpha [Nanoarchaeota archaeon]|nr:pyruvate dehydrogenase (acetyl-transferring) E1 component subunit alpha [Nanoarchaeota archaeon]